MNSPALAELMFELSEFSVQLCLDQKDEALIGLIGRDILIDTVTNSILPKAEEIMQKHIKSVLPTKLYKSIYDLKDTTPSLYKSWKL